MLSSLLRTIPKHEDSVPSPEDYFHASLGLIFTDDLRNSHGDADTVVHYRSNGYGDLVFEVADLPASAGVERSKFAHHLWNSGVLLGELVSGRNKESTTKSTEDDWGQREFSNGQDWWLNDDDEQKWSVADKTVLELGAGVGLAGIMSLLSGAKQVTLTDYPSENILRNLRCNVETIIPDNLRNKMSVEAHQWGDTTSDFAKTHRGCFDRILAADTLWLAAEHDTLAQSMNHFLSTDASARVLLIAGFHTGRGKIAAFFEEAVPKHDLEVQEIFEMDADGRKRVWNPDAAEEPVGERKKWVVLARLMTRIRSVDVSAAPSPLRD